MFDQPLDPDLVRGALELERTDVGLRPHRLPARARRQYSDPQIAMAEAQPSGVRLVFRTAADVVELDTHRTVFTYRGAPARPEGVYDLVVDGEVVARASTTGGTLVEVDMTTGERVNTPGPAGTVRFGLPAGEHDVEVWLPTHEITDLVALRADAPLHPSSGPGRPVWLHHGSSISHGSGAASPTATWPAIAARGAGVELVNLGFGGSALLDPFTARAIRDTPADVISVKLGINVVNADLMRLRAFVPAVHGFLDTIRDGHPHTPLLVVSALACPIHEDTPGPGAPVFGPDGLRFEATGDPAEVPAGRLTLRVIRQALADVVAGRDDEHLAYLDGRELYGEADTLDHPLPDALHPDAATHRLIGERFGLAAFGPRGFFSAALAAPATAGARR